MDTAKQVQFTTIKNKVDGLMDILFGAGVASHTTIIEQLNYLLFLRALTKRDEDSIAVDNIEKQIFKGDLTKYRWNNILMLNAEDLFTTLEQIYRKLPELINDRTINLLYRDAHVKIYDKPTLRRFLHEIEKMMNDLEKEYQVGHNDIFGDMYEYLLSKLSQAGTMGQFRTPRHIIDFIVKVVDPKKGETILDPACGTAGFLVSALEHLKHNYSSDEFKKEGKYPMDLLSPDERTFIFTHTFTGFDSDSDMIKFGLMNLYLHQLEHPQIIRQNTLVDTAGDRTKWDVILANPPFAGALDQDSISQDLRMGTRATEVLFLRYMIEHLSLNGRAGIIVPEGIIFSNSNAHRKIRQMLIEEAGLWCVVSLPSGVFNPYAGVKTSIVFFDKKLVNKNDEILFIKIENDGFSLGAQRNPIDKNDLIQTLEMVTNYKYFKQTRDTQNDPFLDRIKANEKIGETISITHDRYSLVAKKLITKSDDLNLSVDRYKVEELFTNQTWPIVKLEDISVFIQRGRSPLYGKSNLQVIKSGQARGYREFDFTKKYYVVDNFHVDQRLLKKGDLLINSTGVGTAGRVTYYALDGHHLVDSHITIVRLNQNNAYPIFILYFLANYYGFKGLENLAQGNGGQVELSLQTIKNLKIPLPPLEIQQQIVDEIENYQKIIDGAKQVIENWKIRIDIDPTWGKVKLPEISKNNDGKRKPVTKLERVAGPYPYYGASGIVDYVSSYIFDDNYLLISEDGANLLARSTPIAFSISGKTWVNNHAHILKFSNYVTQKFVEFYFNQTDIRSFISGMAQPKLNQQALNSIQIPLPPVEIQQQIVDQIEEEQKLLEANKKLIEIYEQKIKEKIAKLWTDK